MPLKVTTWNLEHSHRLLSANPSTNVLDRRGRVRATIESIDPDILCIQEGPKGEQAIDDFCTQVLDRRWVPILLRQDGDALGDRDKEYQTKGNQWIWFLVRLALAPDCWLQSPDTWQAFTGMGTWPVHFWGEEKAMAEELLGLPGNYELTALLKIGVPGEKGLAPDKNPWAPRRPEFSWLHKNRFGNRD